MLAVVINVVGALLAILLTADAATDRCFAVIVLAEILWEMCIRDRLAITTGSLPSKTATQLFVVPKSIPITFPIIIYTHHGRAQRLLRCMARGKEQIKK